MICSFFSLFLFYFIFLPPVTFGVLTNIATFLWSVLEEGCLCGMGWTSCFCFLPESTHSRVMYFSIFSMACLLGLATWQVLYLRRYFKAKKLIEWCGLVTRVLHVSRMSPFHTIISLLRGVAYSFWSQRFFVDVCIVLWIALLPSFFSKFYPSQWHHARLSACRRAHCQENSRKWWHTLTSSRTVALLAVLMGKESKPFIVSFLYFIRPRIILARDCFQLLDVAYI